MAAWCIRVPVNFASSAEDERVYPGTLWTVRRDLRSTTARFRVLYGTIFDPQASYPGLLVQFGHGVSRPLLAATMERFNNGAIQDSHQRSFQRAFTFIVSILAFSIPIVLSVLSGFVYLFIVPDRARAA